MGDSKVAIGVRDRDGQMARHTSSLSVGMLVDIIVVSMASLAITECTWKIGPNTLRYPQTQSHPIHRQMLHDPPATAPHLHLHPHHITPSHAFTPLPPLHPSHHSPQPNHPPILAPPPPSPLHIQTITPPLHIQTHYSPPSPNPAFGMLNLTTGMH